MKKVLSTIVAALVAMSFSAVVFAADMPAGHPPVGANAAAPAAEKKEVKKTKKAKKVKKAKKEEAPKADAAAPAAK